MLKALGAALAALLMTTSAQARTIVIENIVHNPLKEPPAHNQYTVIIDNFGPINMTAGDALSYKGMFDAPLFVPKGGWFETVITEVGFEIEPSCAWACDFRDPGFNYGQKLYKEQNFNFYGGKAPEYEIMAGAIIPFGTDGSIGGFSITLNFVGPPGSAATASTFSMLAISAPEPASWALMILGIVAMSGLFRMRRQMIEISNPSMS